MSTFGYGYRRRLQEYLDQGVFAREPGREKVLQTMVTEWERWAQLASQEHKILARAQKWFWAGIIPGVVIFLYGVWFGYYKVDPQYRKLEEACKTVMTFRDKFGASSVENEAIQSVNAETP